MCSKYQSAACCRDPEREHAYLCVMVIQCYAGCCRHTSLSSVRRRLLSTSVLSALHTHRRASCVNAAAPRNHRAPGAGPPSLHSKSTDSRWNWSQAAGYTAVRYYDLIKRVANNNRPLNTQETRSIISILWKSCFCPLDECESGILSPFSFVLLLADSWREYQLLNVPLCSPASC